MLKYKIISGMLWQGMERVGAQAILFLTQIILARLLSPDDFGIIAILAIFIALAEAFVDSGFRSSLIQRKDLKDEDCQSVFWLNLFTSAVLYLVLFVAAPYIAAFYQQPELSLLLRVLALAPVIHGVTLVHNALLLKQMLFKKKLQVEWSGLISAMAVGIGMALTGFGVWALVVQQLTQAVVSGVAVAIAVHWRPRFYIDFGTLKSLFSFGSYLLGVSLLSTFISNLFRLVIGKFFSMGTLGAYNMGNGIPRMAMSSLNMTMSTVLFSAFSTVQNSSQIIRSTFIRVIGVINFMVFPMLLLLVATATPLVRTMLGEQWVETGAILQINSLGYLLWPSHLINVQVCMSTGRSRLCFLLELVKDAVLIAVIFVTCHYSVIAMSWGFVLYSVISFYLNALPSKKIIGYGPWAQFKALFRNLLLSGIACGVTMAVGYFLSSLVYYLLLIVEIAVFSLVFLGLNFCFNRRCLFDLRNMVFDLLKKKSLPDSAAAELS